MRNEPARGARVTAEARSASSGASSADGATRAPKPATSAAAVRRTTSGPMTESSMTCAGGSPTAPTSTPQRSR
jgi:hypothetical protein